MNAFFLLIYSVRKICNLCQSNYDKNVFKIDGFYAINITLLISKTANNRRHENYNYLSKMHLRNLIYIYRHPLCCICYHIWETCRCIQRHFDLGVPHRQH